MPFTIPEIYVGQVVSGEAVLTNAQIDTQINPAPLAQTPTYNPPVSGEISGGLKSWERVRDAINDAQAPTYNPSLQPQRRSSPTSYEEVCQDGMHNGVPVKECFLMPVYEE